MSSAGVHTRSKAKAMEGSDWPVKLETRRTSQTCEKPEIGLAFSGGGIRSASFCSGVLRKLLRDGARITQISSVSGGGYVGTSYLEWLAQEQMRSNACGQGQAPIAMDAVMEPYFNHLQKHFALYCDWQNDFPKKGIRDTLIFFATAILSFVILPVCMFVTCAIPLAIRVETIFGQVMRDAFAHPTDHHVHKAESACGHGNKLSVASIGHHPILTYSFIGMLVGAALLRLAPRYEQRSTVRYVLGMWLGAETLLLSGLVFLPCLFEMARLASSDQSAEEAGLFDMNTMMQVALILLYALLWVLIPQSPFHQRFGHVVISLAAARLVQWRVFSLPNEMDAPSTEWFRFSTVVVAVLVMLMPILGPLKFSLPFLYNR